MSIFPVAIQSNGIEAIIYDYDAQISIYFILFHLLSAQDDYVMSAQ